MENSFKRANSAPKQSSIQRTIRYLIAKIDTILDQQTKAIFNNQKLQDLLSIWSATHYLLQNQDKEYIRVKIFDLKWAELYKISDTSYDLDDFLSRKILDEQDTPGQHPISLLLSNYILDVSDPKIVNILDQIGLICSYTFIPFLNGIDFKIFDVDNLEDLDRFSFEEIHRSTKFTSLVNLAKQSHSNFIGLVIPNIFFPSLLAQYNNKQQLQIEIPTVILGSGAFAVARIIMGSFANTGWFLDMLGTHVQEDGISSDFGSVPNLVKRPTIKEKNLDLIHLQANAQFFLSEGKEKELSDIGMIPLCQMRNQEKVILYNTKSLRNLYLKQLKTKELDSSSIIQYLLCVCRFAHYIKIIGRTKIGSFSNVNEFQSYIQSWLINYIASNLEASTSIKRRFPLLSAKVIINEDAFLKNNYKCMIYLKPHLVSMEIAADIVLKTSIQAPK